MSKKLIVEVERENSDHPEISAIRIRHGFDRGVFLTDAEARQLSKLLYGLYRPD